MDLCVLGALTVDDGRLMPAPRDRLVLGALAARIGRSVSSESLGAALWGEDPPASWAKVVPGCIMRLRRLIAPAEIRTTPIGYVLVATSIDLDAERFERLVARGGDLLELGEPDRAVHALSEALALWRGEPFAELADWEPARIEASRLDEIRLAAEESLLEARLQSGDLAEAAAHARARVAEAPLRERRWVILGLAQYGQGRQAEALATVRGGRELLATELGLDPSAELAALEKAILRQDPALQSGIVFRAASAQCPYFGLPPAGVEDGERFFGREAELARAVAAVDRDGVLIVSGSSGVGKSSFIRAGIAAHFAARGMRVVVITPGERPMEMLREHAVHDPATLLIIDQCEQALAIDDPDQTRAFFDEVRRLVFAGPVVLSVRADRLGDLADRHGFAGLIESHLLMLGPLSDEELRTIIEKPARQAGLILEPGLVEVLTRDATGRALPLLSHALRQVWQRREGRVLSVEAYREAGEIDGAVAQTAEEVFAALSEEGRSQVRDILLRLVEPSPGGGVVCQRVDHASVAIDHAHERVVDRLVDARLITSDEQSFQLSHEAVAREWPRLREWLADDVEGQRIMRHLHSAATAWQAMEMPDSELYRGARLRAAAHWRESAAPVLTAVESAFLDSSIGQEAADLEATQRQLQREKRSVRRLRWLAAAAASLAVIAVTAGSVVAVQMGAANERAVVDDARRVSALAGAEPMPERALLLAVEAIRLWDAPETRMMLLDVLARSPRVASVTRLDGGVGIQQMALGEDGATALLVDDEQGATTVDLERRRQAGHLGVEGKPVLDAVGMPDGKVLLSILEGPCDARGWCDSPALRTMDLREPAGAETIFADVSRENAAIDVEFSADGALAAAVAPLPWVDEPRNLWIMRMDDPRATLVLRIPHVGLNPGAANWANAFGRLRFSPDGTRLYASGYGPTAIFDTQTGALIRELDGEGILAISPDGGSVLIRDSQTAVHIVHLEDPTEGRRLDMREIIIDAAFSPDGESIVTAGRGGAWLWSARTGEHTESLGGHTGDVTSAAFLPTGDLVTAGRDGALITWAMGDWSRDFRDGIASTSGSDIPRDERTLVIERPDGSALVIRADPAAWLDRACTVAGRGLTEEEWRAVFDSRTFDPACTESGGSASQ